MFDALLAGVSHPHTPVEFIRQNEDARVCVNQLLIILSYSTPARQAGELSRVQSEALLWSCGSQDQGRVFALHFAP